MLHLYINLSGSADGDGLTTITPWTYSQWKTHISAGTVDEDVTYHLWGSYEIATLGATENLLFNVAADHAIILDGWETETEPWKIYHVNGAGADRLYIAVSQASSFTMKNGMLQNTATGLTENIIIAGTKTGHTQTLSADNMHVMCGENISLLLNLWDDIHVGNSNIVVDDLNCFSHGRTATFTNSIIIADNIKAGYTVPVTSATDYTFNECVFNKDITTYAAYAYCTFGNYDDLWTCPAALSAVDVSAVTKDDLNYLSADFSGITVSGDITQSTSTWWSGRRDGVGALYFPVMTLTVDDTTPPYISAGETFDRSLSAGVVDTVLDDSHIRDMHVYTGGIYDGDPYSDYTPDAIDGYLSAGISDIVYTGAGIFTISATIESQRGWYEAECLQDVHCYGAPYDGIDSLILDNAETLLFGTPGSLTVTSAEQDQLIQPAVQLSASGSMYTWEVDYGDGNVVGTYTSADAQSIATEILFPAHSYSADGDFIIQVSINCVSAGDTRAASISASIHVEGLETSFIRYVNINDSYDDTPYDTSGTETYPYTWAQFKTLLAGAGRKYTCFKLAGGRRLEYPAGEYDWEPLEGYSSKRYTMDAWDTSVYGPWFITIVEGNGVSYSRVTLTGVSLHNGILVNEPYYGEGESIAGTLFANSMYNMFVVWQGGNSKMFISTTTFALTSGGDVELVTDQCHIVGSTFYSENPIWGMGLTGPTKHVVLIDSVLTGFRTSADHSITGSPQLWTSACTFDTSGAGELSAFFIVNETGTANQWDWDPPSPYPFTPADLDTYGMDLSSLLFDPTILRPFTGITTPPVPGDGYPSYPLYDTDLFGNLRASFSW